MALRIARVNYVFALRSVVLSSGGFSQPDDLWSYRDSDAVRADPACWCEMRQVDTNWDIPNNNMLSRCPPRVHHIRQQPPSPHILHFEQFNYQQHYSVIQPTTEFTPWIHPGQSSEFNHVRKKCGSSTSRLLSICRTIGKHDLRILE